jgi:hypothetical protein
LFQCQLRRVQRFSMFDESCKTSGALESAVYHARRFGPFQEPAA